MAVNIEKELPILQEVAKKYGLDSEQSRMLYAMRMSEDGPPGYEFGVKAAKGTDLTEQASQAAVSIKKNVPRYKLFQELNPNKGVDFVTFMAYHGGPVGKGWAPINGVPKSEASLNKNWAHNVKKNMDTLMAMGI